MSSTVILGAGIIGLSTAYYLSEHQQPSSILLVEPARELFSSASGFAGGFLAKDWFAAPVAPLGKLSFEQHRILAKQNDGSAKWGYSGSTALSYTVESQPTRSGTRGEDWLRQGTSRAEAAVAAEDDALGKAPSWLRRSNEDRIELISAEDTTAQVDPLKLCQFLLEACLARGVRLYHPAKATSVHMDAEGEIASVSIVLGDETSHEINFSCTRIIITAGAWSPQVFKELFPLSQLKLPISSLAGHSLVLSTPRWTAELEDKGCHAIFTTTRQGYSPEIFSRLGGHIYLAGLNSSSIPLPVRAGEQQLQDSAIAQLKQTAETLLGPKANTGDVQILRQGLCFRPMTPTGIPIIDRIGNKDLGLGVSTRCGAAGGIFLAAGHGPWGISLSLGTGYVLAELVQGRPLSADISMLTLP